MGPQDKVWFASMRMFYAQSFRSLNIFADFFAYLLLFYFGLIPITAVADLSQTRALHKGRQYAYWLLQ